MLGRFALLTDENVKGALIAGLRSRGWDVLRAFDVFGQGQVDDTIFAFAAEHNRVLVSTDPDCLAIAVKWLDQGRAFRLIFWQQGKYEHAPVGALLAAFEALTTSETAFAACIEYLDVSRYL